MAEYENIFSRPEDYVSPEDRLRGLTSRGKMTPMPPKLDEGFKPSPRLSGKSEDTPPAAIETKPPVTGFQPSPRLSGPSQDAEPQPGSGRPIHGAASQPPSPNLTGPSQDTNPADRRVHGAASQEPSPNLNARHPAFPTYEQLHPKDRAGAAGLNVGDPYPPQQPDTPEGNNAGTERSTDEDIHPPQQPETKTKTAPTITVTGSRPGGGGGGGAGGARGGRKALGDQTRTEAYDPTLDRADPRNVAITDTQGRVNPKLWEDSQKGALDPTKPGVKTGEAAAKYTNQYTTALAGATKYMEDTFHQKKGDPNRNEGYQAMTFKGVGAPDPKVVDDVFKVVDPNNELVPKERMELATRAMHDWYTSRGDTKNADKVAAEMLQHGNKQAQMHGNNVIAAMKKGDHQGAVAEIQKAYDWLPDGYSADVKGNNLVIADNKGKVLNNIPLDDKMIQNLGVGLATGTLYWDVVQNRANKPGTFVPPTSQPQQAISPTAPGGASPAPVPGSPSGAPPARPTPGAAPPAPPTAGTPAGAPSPGPPPAGSSPPAAGTPAPPPAAAPASPPVRPPVPPPPVTPPGNRPAAPAPAAPGPAPTQQAAPPPVTTPAPPPPQGSGGPPGSPAGDQKPALDTSKPPMQLTPDAKGNISFGATGPAKTEPAKTEPAKTEPAKTEPVKTEPVKTEDAKSVGKVEVKSEDNKKGEKRFVYDKDDPDTVPIDKQTGQPAVFRRRSEDHSPEVKVAIQRAQKITEWYQNEKKELVEDMKTRNLSLKDKEVAKAVGFRQNWLDTKYKADMKEQEDVIKKFREDQKKADEKEEQALKPRYLRDTELQRAEQTITEKIKDYKDSKDPSIKNSPLRLITDDKKLAPIRDVILEVHAHNRTGPNSVPLEKVIDGVITATQHLGTDKEGKAQTANEGEGPTASRFRVIAHDLSGNPVVMIGVGNKAMQLHMPQSALNEIKRLKGESYAAEDKELKKDQAKHESRTRLKEGAAELFGLKGKQGAKPLGNFIDKHIIGDKPREKL